MEHELSKPVLDIGYFTNRIDEVLAFWREEMGLAYEPPIPFNDGLVQYRHALGDSVIKINCRDGGVNENMPGGYGRLSIARDDLSAPETKTDPDGNEIRLVPYGFEGITGVGIEILTPEPATQSEFFTVAMGWSQISENRFKAGNSILEITFDKDRPYAGHWVNCGFRYFTLHVMRVDESFEKIIQAGGTVGERPYAIGDIAKISFIRDPFGNWVEVAQRRELAGPW